MGKAADFEFTNWPTRALPAEDGSLYVVTEPWGDPPWIQISHCDDTSCDASETSILHTLPGPGTYTPFDATLGADPLPRLVWTTRSGYEYARCTDSACEQVQVTQTGIVAKRLAIEMNPQGLAIVIAVDEQGISLTFCPDDNCNV